MEIVLIVLVLVTAGLGVYAWQLREQVAEQKQTIERGKRDLKARGETLDAANTQLAGHEQTITRLRTQMQTLADAAYEALIVVDADCNVIVLNESAEILFGAENPQGQTLLAMTGIEELSMIVADAVRNEEETFEEQINIEHRNYRVQSRVRHEGDQVYIGLALSDVTRLVRLNRARRDMVANISHELRHPIANIRLMIDSLFHEQEKPKRKDTISSLRAIARETDALMWLVQEMSDLAMIESGQAIVRMVSVALTELVDEAIERVEDQSHVQNVSIVRHIPEKVHVLCDRDLAQRVVVNLIHNAVKWSPEGETITISAMDGDDEVTISVYDNGPGVPDEQVERIFERFYQVDDSRSRGEGTGLGLAICRHIVEAHGGRIWAEGNSKGAGGRFRFTLLAAEEEQSFNGEEMLPEARPVEVPDEVPDRAED